MYIHVRVLHMPVRNIRREIINKQVTEQDLINEFVNRTCKSDITTELRFNLQKDFQLHEFYIRNVQVLVQLLKGNFVVIPRNITATNIKTYLGVNYAFVYRWCILPDRSSKFNKDLIPLYLIQSGFVPTESIYDRLQRD